MTSERAGWRFYRDGKIVPITEAEARKTFEKWDILSDDRGAGLLMIDQLWQEIDRLRLALAEAYLIIDNCGVATLIKNRVSIEPPADA